MPPDDCESISNIIQIFSNFANCSDSVTDGREPEQVNYYLERGLPHPLLTVLEFLSADDGGLRWGRSFHRAGYFAGALLW